MSLVLAVLAASLSTTPSASHPRPQSNSARASESARREASAYVPKPADVAPPDPSELASLVDRFAADRAALLRLWNVPTSQMRRDRLGAFYKAWGARLDTTPFDKLSLAAKVDYTLFRVQLGRELRLLDREQRASEQAAPLLPFLPSLQALPEARRRLESVDPAAAAQVLAVAARQANAARKGLDPSAKPSKVVAARAVERIKEVKTALADWYSHYDHFDPSFSWWIRDPYARVVEALDGYTKGLREDVIGAKAGDDDPIIGEPLGRQEILDDLADEMIPYSPEELVDIANREFAWCEAEMKKASREMGFGDDWKKALDKVRTLSVPPGGQVDLVRGLALEAIEFVEKKELVTVPALAADLWGWDMLSPEKQKTAPFFLGGETVQIAYPTDTMSQEDKLDSIRANNEPFSRAVVHHELIPGHHLQGFMTARYSTHRRIFRTPFWGEGWALWFEFLLWDEGFPRTPEDRVGMLFWRMHRCARIIFSLSFHLGTMTPEQCVDFLVDRVGHERWTAEGEVRRSFGGEYAPLYQTAYMLGALQLRALHKELVDGGRMSNRVFHDRILKEGPVPIEMVRALLLKEAPVRPFRSRWRFAG